MRQIEERKSVSSNPPERAAKPLWDWRKMIGDFTKVGLLERF
jgi:hypothetical protein